jgi:hypothetical protein
MYKFQKMNYIFKKPLTMRIILDIIPIVNENHYQRRGSDRKMKKGIKLLSTALLTGALLVGCNTETKEEPQNNDQNQQQDEFAVETTVTAKQVATYKSMKDELANAKENNPVDWDQVFALYQTMQSAVTEISSEFDQALVAAIEGGKTEQIDANVARQLIDKTTQSYFYQKQKRLHKDVIAAMNAGNDVEAKHTFAELKHLVNEVILPTAVKRDSYYELTGKDSMEQNILAGLAAQEEALNAGNVDDFSVYVQLTDKSVYRSHYLAAQSYAEKIEKAVAEGETDAIVLQNKQAEAWGFYQAIKGSLSSGDQAAATKLDELFSLHMTNPQSISANDVKELFTKAFVGKITSYHTKAPKALADGDVTSARVKALEGNVFMQDIKLVMTEKLGEEATNEAFSNAEKWFASISENNSEEAAQYSALIVETLNQLVK